MRFANFSRVLILGALIVAGLVVFKVGRDGDQHDPGAVTSISDSPITVTVLDGRKS